MVTTRLHQVCDLLDFHRQLAGAGRRLVVVMFAAAWCGACRKLAPGLEEVTRRFPAAVFLKVDVDQLDQLAAEYVVNAVPTFVFVRSGKMVDSFAGANEEKLVQVMASLG
ncbi:uncharacterized protein LOC134531931 isoform X4 [Bacillus rossius redtenbacheri]|uniref:uncharacterized protein LOC134531931 isoform X4 n=1 Tax=Bacillus rossius redtenbacheri TaxID=93214 RepID=UPI002FDC911B